jgi:hypothetical protein
LASIGFVSHIITTTMPDPSADRSTRAELLGDTYDCGLVSQGRGAEIAGLSRWKFIQALGRAEVPACQVTSEDLKEEVERAYAAHRQRVAAHPSDQDRSD